MAQTIPTADRSRYYMGIEIRPCAWAGPWKWYLPNGILDERLCRRFESLMAAKWHIKYERSPIVPDVD